MMARSYLSKEEHNFTCCAKACLDLIPLPLIDILDDVIKPIDLHNEISKSSLSNKLNKGQKVICYISPPGVPQYNQFDVTLLYTLIRNLCLSLKPTQGWGKKPNPADTKIGDDIERLRLFRNKYFAHANSATISDQKFQSRWQKLKSVIQRIQTYTKAWSKTDYVQTLTEIENFRFGFHDLEKYKRFLDAILYTSKQSEFIGKLLFDSNLTFKKTRKDLISNHVII